MKKQKQLLVLAMVLGLASTPLMASGDMDFGNLDSDGNGALSSEEAEAAGLSLEKVDANDDGEISKSEYQNATSSKEEEAS